MARSLTRRDLFRSIAQCLARPTPDSPLVRRWLRHSCAHGTDLDSGPCMLCQQEQQALCQQEQQAQAQQEASKKHVEGIREVARKSGHLPSVQPMPASLERFVRNTGPLYKHVAIPRQNTLDLSSKDDAPCAVNPLAQFAHTSLNDDWLNSPPPPKRPVHQTKKLVSQNLPDLDDTKEAPAIVYWQQRVKHPSRQGDSS